MSHLRIDENQVEKDVVEIRRKLTLHFLRVPFEKPAIPIVIAIFPHRERVPKCHGEWIFYLSGHDSWNFDGRIIGHKRCCQPSVTVLRLYNSLGTCDCGVSSVSVRMQQKTVNRME